MTHSVAQCDHIAYVSDRELFRGCELENMYCKLCLLAMAQCTAILTYFRLAVVSSESSWAGA